MLMGRLSGAEKYLSRYSNIDGRKIVARSLEGVKHAVVIPVLQERDNLFKTLASLARNPAADLQQTMVVCVVNNHRPELAGIEAVADNQKTIALLCELVNKSSISNICDYNVKVDCDVVAASAIRLAYVDASSPGAEIPDTDGGVGAARKIGMDAALMILDGRGAGEGVISCLDADTLVENGCLPAIAAFFQENRFPAATVGYAHQPPADAVLLSAICRYEIYLRAYVIGLGFAGSPYAFPSIGSTISCTAESYVAVRGMNRRAVAEDFHFLDKLAKLGRVGFIGGTTVHPSARLSRRVAFGTGRKMHYFLEEAKDEYLIHNPAIFLVLRDWLATMATSANRSAGAIMKSAGDIHPLLQEYLDAADFSGSWEMIRRNCANDRQLLRQFHVWFDGLKTLRLVHHLARGPYPPIDMFIGLKQLMKMKNTTLPVLERALSSPFTPEMQLAMLCELRRQFPAS